MIRQKTSAALQNLSQVCFPLCVPRGTLEARHSQSSTKNAWLTHTLLHSLDHLLALPSGDIAGNGRGRGWPAPNSSTKEVQGFFWPASRRQCPEQFLSHLPVPPPALALHRELRQLRPSFP